MWEAIGQAIKTFVEKHLIPTVISVVIAISSFLILPTDFLMIERIGKLTSHGSEYSIVKYKNGYCRPRKNFEQKR